MFFAKTDGGRVFSGVIKDLADVGTSILFTYDYERDGKGWHGDFSGIIDDEGNINGFWYEHTPDGKELKGKALFKSRVIGDRYVLVGTWTGAAQDTNRWTVDIPASRVLGEDVNRRG